MIVRGPFFITVTDGQNIQILRLVGRIPGNDIGSGKAGQIIAGLSQFVSKQIGCVAAFASRGYLLACVFQPQVGEGDKECRNKTAER